MIAEQRRLNRTTRDNTALFAEHRRRLTTLVMDAVTASRARRVLVLGAGNCNDLELALLCRAAEEVHLVDIDGEALTHARGGLPLAERERVVVHAGLDVSGAMAFLCGRAERRLADEDLERLAGACIDEPLALLPVGADVVVSPCLLSQLMDGARRALGTSHLDLPMAARALLIGHLRLLTRVLRPGGIGLLASDVIDLDGVPAETLRLPPRDLLRWAVTTGNVFTGTDPALAGAILREDEFAAPLVGDLALEPPWRWQLSSPRAYLVYALRFTREPVPETGTASAASAARP